MIWVLRAAILMMCLTSPFAAAADDSCEYAQDGECDEGRFGGGSACLTDTDSTDCAAISATADCDYAFDFQCDEERHGGTGLCAAGTDTLDCELLAAGADGDSCTFANDGECDEPRFGGNNCRDGSDRTDCQAQQDEIAAMIEALPQDVRRRLGDDSCEFANDLECDDASFGGTSFCAAGTDAADCWALAAGGTDTCIYASDNECDEPGIGTGLCMSGSDMTDCAAVDFLRNRTNDCAAAFNQSCDEPGSGSGICQAESDTADCLGRSRPAEAGDHFFGRDDRFLPNSAEMPWRAIGLLSSDDSDCTGTLIGPRLVLTAAHCVTAEGTTTIVFPDFFYAGKNGGSYSGRSAVVDVMIAPDYTPEDKAENGGNGNDWALVTLRRDLGNTAGYLPVHELDAEDIARVGQGGLLISQAGYSWDTGDYLSGHVGCRVTRVFDDASILHECDTTRGDSGSPLLVERDGGWAIIAVESQFFDPEDKNNTFSSANLAVDSRAFAAAVRAALGQ
jgi:V8-like Glu-specific endopeptidase